MQLKSHNASGGALVRPKPRGHGIRAAAELLVGHLCLSPLERHTIGRIVDEVVDSQGRCFAKVDGGGVELRQDPLGLAVVVCLDLS